MSLLKNTVSKLVKLLENMNPNKRTPLIIYLIVSVIVLCLAFHVTLSKCTNVERAILNFFIFIACVISVFKGIYRRMEYQSLTAVNPTDTIIPNSTLDHFSKNEYKRYQLFVLSFWMGFMVLCVIGKCTVLNPWYFLSGVFFLYALDIIFYSGLCFLNFIACKTIHSRIQCCHYCPVRGWDLLMLTFPIIFVWNQTVWFLKPFIAAALFASLLNLITWETHKYSILDIIHIKTKHPKACGKCRQTCGIEYKDGRRCYRNIIG